MEPSADTAPGGWEGYLLKKSVNPFLHNTWSRRFFVLAGTTLSSYDGTRMKGRMGVAGAVLALQPESKYNRALAFQVSAGAERLILQAESPEQLSAFSGALAAASGAAPPMRGVLSHLVPATFARGRRWAQRLCILSGGVLAWHASEAAAAARKRPLGMLRLARGGRGAQVLTGAAAAAAAAAGPYGALEEAVAPLALLVLLGRRAGPPSSGGGLAADPLPSSASGGGAPLGSFQEHLLVLAPSAALLEQWARALQLALRAESIAGSAGRAAAGGSADAASLMAACQEGQLEAVHALVARGGVDVNEATQEDGTTALMLACENGHLEVARLLVEHGGASANAARTSDGMTPLMFAAQDGSLEIARLLVERGRASVNAARTDDGSTALMVACEFGQLDIVKYLVGSAGASVHAATTDIGATPLILASLSGSLEIVRLLVERGGADVHAAISTDGSTALMAACERGHLGVAGYLLRQPGVSAAVNAVLATSGGTALTWACWQGHAHLIPLLYSHGATLNAITSSANLPAAAAAGSTPLMLAAREGHADAVRALLQLGADATAADAEGLTALAHAQHHPEVEALLEEALQEQSLQAASA